MPQLHLWKNPRLSYVLVLFLACLYSSRVHFCQILYVITDHNHSLTLLFNHSQHSYPSHSKLHSHTHSPCTQYSFAQPNNQIYMHHQRLMKTVTSISIFLLIDPIQYLVTLRATNETYSAVPRHGSSFPIANMLQSKTNSKFRYHHTANSENCLTHQPASTPTGVAVGFTLELVLVGFINGYY